MEGRSEECAGRAARAARQAARLAPEEAAALLEAAVAELGPLPALATPLADALAPLGRDEALVGLCRRVLDGGLDPRERPAWELRLAEACERLGDVEAAVAAHRAVLDASPRERRSLRALQRMHRAGGDRAALVRALESELALCAGEEEIGLRLELAGLLSEDATRVTDALRHLRRVLDLEPERPRVLERALALAESIGAAGDQVAILEVALARAQTPAARAGLLARQAALLAGPLASPAQAVSRWQEALAVEPSLGGVHEPMRCTLERLGDWNALLECLLEEARNASPEARRTLLERGAAVATEHFGPDAALPWLLRMRGEAPGDRSVLERMAALHHAAGRREALRAVLEELGDPTLRGERPVGLPRGDDGCVRRDPADLGPPVPGPPDDLAGAGVGTRRRAPGGARFQPSFEDPAREAAAAEEELARLDAGAPVYAERRRTLEHRLARLYAGPLGDAERALRHLRAVAATPADARGVASVEGERLWAEHRLLDLLRGDGSFVELEERLAARLARAPDDPEAWIELARLREASLHAPAGAADAYREALRRGAEPGLALRGLRRACSALGDWPEVARTLEAELERDVSPARRADLLRELGEVTWHRLGATTRASRAFAAALEADPRDLVSLRSLRALLASMEDWRGALDLVESEIELLPPGDVTGRRTLWIEAAGIAADRVRDPERAIRALEAAHALAPLGVAERRTLSTLLHRSGDLARYVEVTEALFAQSPPEDAGDWLRLGHACLELHRLESARLHAKQAVLASPAREAAWELLAEVELAQGRASEAAESLLRAAEVSGPARAVARLLRAARIVAEVDAEFAHGLCEAACARDAGSASAWLARARSAAGLGRREEAETSAVRAVELAAAWPSAVEREPVLEVGLAAAASARTDGRLERAARLLAALRAFAPQSGEVLHGQALVLRALGDAAGALRAAEALVEIDDAAAKDPAVVVTMAEGLAAEGLLDEAVERFSAAAAADPGLGPAWEGLARALEASGRTAEALDALDAWASHAPPESRVARLLGAAELAFRRGDRGPLPEARLRTILREQPACLRGAELLARQLLDEGRPAEACRVLEDAGARVPPGEASAPLERLRALALEDLGRIPEACHAWSRVLEEDPGASDAAHARAALLRGRGEWREAARTLEAFLAGARGRVAPEVEAQAWLDLAELRALPLEDRRGATEACREAVLACPAHRRARETLADALSFDVSARGEAVMRHLELLESTPERLASVEALARLAEICGDEAAAHDGRAILRALGAGEPAAPSRLRFRSAAPRLENAVWERARRLACALSRELARALGASRTLEPPPLGEGPAAFRLSAVVAEAGLSAAALVPLTDEAAHAVLATAAVLAAERPVVSGDGRLVNALAGALGHRARRRAREALSGTSPEEIAEIDAVAWRAALRGLAHAVALDATGGDLRSALLALLDDADGVPAAGSERPFLDRVAAHPAARELLRRTVLGWGRTLLPAREPG